MPKFKSYVKVRLLGNEFFFGPGTCRLLECIKDTGSVVAACSKMGLSYSKGRKMIKIMESELGFELVHRNKGGINGGQACITEDGQKFLDTFYLYQNDVTEYAEKTFGKYFK